MENILKNAAGNSHFCFRSAENQICNRKPIDPVWYDINRQSLEDTLKIKCKRKSNLKAEINWSRLVWY